MEEIRCLEEDSSCGHLKTNLKMEFYYDVVDRFIDRRDFWFCEMDTDTFMNIWKNQLFITFQFI